MDNWEDGFSSDVFGSGEYYEDGGSDFGRAAEQGVVILPNGDVPEYTEGWPTESAYPEEKAFAIQPVESYDDILGIQKEADESMLSTPEIMETAEEGAVLGVDNQQEKEIVYRILGTSGGENTIYSIDDVYSVMLDLRTELRNLNRHQENQETFGYVTVALLSMIMGGIVAYGFFRRII